MSTMQSNFEKFTNLYSVNKTLKFELKPIGETMNNISNKNIISIDSERLEKYKKIKPILDKLHDDFIKESLSTVKLDWQDFFVFYERYKEKMQNKSKLKENEIKKLNKEFDSRKKDIKKHIQNTYDNTSKEWKERYKNEDGESLLKKSSYNILLEQGILNVLKEIHKNYDETLEDINYFKGFFSYFEGYNKNRENFYTNEGYSTEITYRIVDQNMVKFFNNILTYKKLERDGLIDDIGLTEEEKKIFEPNFYNNCLTQTDIDNYNYILGGNIDENGKRISKGI